MNKNRIMRNIIAEIVGFLLGAAIFWAGALISLIALAQGVSRDHDSNSMMNSSTNSYLVLCLVAIIASFLGGLVTTLMAEDKNYKPAIITGILLVFMVLVINNYLVSVNSTILYACIGLPALLGAYMILRRKSVQ